MENENKISYKFEFEVDKNPFIGFTSDFAPYAPCGTKPNHRFECEKERTVLWELT